MSNLRYEDEVLNIDSVNINSFSKETIDKLKTQLNLNSSTGPTVDVTESLSTKELNIIDDTSTLVSTYSIENPEWLQVTLDNDDKIISGIKTDGTTYISSLESPSISRINEQIANIPLDELNSISDKMSYEDFDNVYMNAILYDMTNSSRERELRELYNYKRSNENYVGKWYGVEFKEEENPDNVIAINSENCEYLHTDLPIQNKMRRCVTKNNIVQYYLSNDNSEYKEDGVTLAKLDGSDGDVMVEIPEFFYKIEEETIDDVRTIRIKISEDALPDFKFSNKRYTSAYEATVNHSINKLASVCTTLFERNESETIKTISTSSYVKGDVEKCIAKTARRIGFTDNAQQFRGGTNDNSYDNITDITDYNYARNQLGLPIANLNRTTLKSLCSENTFCYLYDTQRILYMLIQVEFKTRNIQKPLSSGGMGVGATVYPSYEAYESYFKPQRGISCIPCGVTNSLGNNTGEVYYLMSNVPISQTSDDNGIYYRFGDVWMPCMSYRGVEHYYGHIYKIVDQVNCLASNTNEYVDGHEGDGYYSIRNIEYWYERNPYVAKLEKISKDKNYLGCYSFASYIMTVKSLMFGEDGHILHIATEGKNYNKNYCDCCELIGPENKQTYITFNGRIVSGSLVGNHFIVAANTVYGTDTRPSDGTRLDHF